MTETTTLNPSNRKPAGPARTIAPGVILAALLEALGISLPDGLAPYTGEAAIALTTYLSSVARNVAAIYPGSWFDTLMRALMVVPK